MNLKLACLVVTVLTIYLVTTHVQVEQFPDVKYLADVPVPVQVMFLEQKPKLFAIVRIANRKLQYVYYGGAHSNYSRFQPLLAVLKQNQGSWRNRIPNGIYVVSVNDGLHTDEYPWPILTFASTKALVEQGRAVLIPDYEALSGYKKLFVKLNVGIHQHPWQRKEEKVFWRGQPTSAIRGKFIDFSKNLDFVDAGFTSYVGFLPESERQGMLQNFSLKPYVAKNASLAYKYLIDVDGQSCSYERMAWIMYSNSLLMKHQTDKAQWYYDRLQAWQHYVPIAYDFSDLYSQYLWAEEHPIEVQAMIKNAHGFALREFSTQAIRRATADGFRSYQKLTASMNASY